MSTQVGIAALMLHLDYTNAEKETLLRRYLQLGIDWHGVIQAGGTDLWEPNGGHASGRKWPIMLAGLMLGDTHMADIGPGDGTGTAHFGEDGQTFYVSQADIDFPRDLSIQDIRGCPGVDSQAPDPNDLPPEMQLPTGYAYQQNNLRLPEWGVRHSTRPQYDNKLWCSGYRQCCTGNAWSGFVLAAHIMGAKDTWDHDPLFDYMDRYMAVETPGTWTRCFDDFAEEMWDTYRADYSVLWPGVRLSSTPLNLTTVRLAWDFEGTVPATTTWQIDYYTQTTTAPLSVTNIISPTRNYNLTGLTSHTWYTVTLYAMLNNIPFISETIRAIATDRIVYLPVVLK